MYYYGSGANDPAISKKLLEFELIEQYHWTYEQIQRTPYRKLQELFVIRKQKNEATQTKINVQKAKQAAQAAVPGKGKKFYREV